MWNPPAVSPTSRTGSRPLGSRLKEKTVTNAARGRSQAPICGVTPTKVLRVRWVSTPTSRPSNERRSPAMRRPMVVESP